MRRPRAGASFFVNFHKVILSLTRSRISHEPRGAFLRSPSGDRLTSHTALDDGLQDDRDNDHETEAELRIEGIDAG